MKKLFFIIGPIVAIASIMCEPTTVAERDYAYEAYCDSIYENNPDYYLDVLQESDEYISYIEKHGEWWD